MTIIIIIITGSAPGLTQSGGGAVLPGTGHQHHHGRRRRDRFRFDRHRVTSHDGPTDGRRFLVGCLVHRVALSVSRLAFTPGSGSLALRLGRRLLRSGCFACCGGLLLPQRKRRYDGWSGSFSLRSRYHRYCEARGRQPGFGTSLRRFVVRDALRFTQLPLRTTATPPVFSPPSIGGVSSLHVWLLHC